VSLRFILEHYAPDAVAVACWLAAAAIDAAWLALELTVWDVRTEREDRM